MANKIFHNENEQIKLPYSAERNYEMASQLSLEMGYKPGDLVIWNKDGCVYEFVETEGKEAIINMPENAEATDFDSNAAGGNKIVPFGEISHVGTLTDVQNVNELRI
jgi:hypothetical protein